MKDYKEAWNELKVCLDDLIKNNEETSNPDSTLSFIELSTLKAIKQVVKDIEKDITEWHQRNLFRIVL